MKKFVPIIIVFAFWTQRSFCQVISSDSHQENIDSVFDEPNYSPDFPGGDQALNEFIENNLNTPESCKGGTVVVKFRIDTSGRVINHRIYEGLNEECNLEALRLLSIMPNWSKGKFGGEPIEVLMILRIKFDGYD